jgi:hypothetical protein
LERERERLREKETEESSPTQRRAVACSITSYNAFSLNPASSEKDAWGALLSPSFSSGLSPSRPILFCLERSRFLCSVAGLSCNEDKPATLHSLAKRFQIFVSEPTCDARARRITMYTFSTYIYVCMYVLHI